MGRQKSIKALEAAEASKKPILLAAQKDAQGRRPAADDIYAVGTLGVVVQLLRLPDGTVKALLEGKKRARILQYVGPMSEFFKVEVEEIEEVCDRTTEVEALMRSVNSTFDNYVRLNKKIPPEMVTSIAAVDDPAFLADKLVGHLGIKLEDKQALLEMHESGRAARAASSATCGRNSKSWKSKSASAPGSRSRWRRPRRSTTSTSRCARFRRSSARKTNSRTKFRNWKRSCGRRRCRPRLAKSASAKSRSSR